MHPSSLLDRARRIRLSVSEIARRAHLDKHTVLRIGDPTRSPLTTTVDKVKAVIERDERDLRDHLFDLHGLPDLPAGTLSVVVDGTPRRLNLPALPRETST